MIIRTDSPCNDCEKRTSTCHGDCKEYKKWRKEMDKERKAIYDRKNKESVVSGYQVQSICKARSKSNKRKSG